QLRALGRRQTRLCVETVRSLNALPLKQHVAIQPLRHENRRLGLSAMQNGEGAEAQLTQPGRYRDNGGSREWQEITALREASLRIGAARCHRHRGRLLGLPSQLSEHRLQRCSITPLGIEDAARNAKSSKGRQSERAKKALYA